MKKLITFSIVVLLFGSVANAQTQEPSKKTIQKKTTKQKVLKAVHSSQMKAALKKVNQDARKEGE